MVVLLIRLSMMHPIACVSIMVLYVRQTLTRDKANKAKEYLLKCYMGMPIH